MNPNNQKLQTGPSAVFIDQENVKSAKSAQGDQQKSLTREEQLKLWKLQNTKKPGAAKPAALQKTNPNIARAKRTEKDKTAEIVKKPASNPKRALSDVCKDSEQSNTAVYPKRAKIQREISSPHMERPPKEKEEELDPELLTHSKIREELDMYDFFIEKARRRRLGESVEGMVPPQAPVPPPPEAGPLARLRFELLGRKKDIECLEKRLSNESRRSAKLDLEVKRCAQDVASLRSLLRQARSDLHESNEAKKDLELELSRKSADQMKALLDVCDKLKGEKQAMAYQLRQLQAEHEAVAAERKQLAEENQKLVSEVATLTTDKQNLQSEMKDCYEVIDLFEEQNREHEKLLEQKENSVSEKDEKFHLELMATEMELLRTRDELEKTKSRAEELRSALEDTLNENQRLEEAVSLKETENQPQNTHAPDTSDSAVQTDLDLDELINDAKEAVQNFRLIKLGNNVMHQQMVQNAEVHEKEKAELEDQIRAEEGKKAEATHAALRQRLMEDVDKANQEKREFEIRLERVKRMTEVLRARIVELGGSVDVEDDEWEMGHLDVLGTGGGTNEVSRL
ncbi:hypothetical protein HK104_000453 [Borealophlyctis nickersoniae]|nr:hypothetical protein HK104_000453 [Borealophlyctis nickersoniae]